MIQEAAEKEKIETLVTSKKSKEKEFQSKYLRNSIWIHPNNPGNR
jgi:hypothetical protein